MKRLMLILPFILSLLMVHGQVKIDRIEPANWFCGMNNPTVQVMVHGENIAAADVTIDYPGVVIDSLVRLDSPNYMLVYLNVGKAEPGTVKMTFSNGKKKKKTVDFPLLARKMKGEERQGFTNADVLYMLMPDRFAQGHADNSKVKTRIPYTIDRTEPSMRHGGDIEGVREHLDYFNELGVTALWLTPVLENDMPEGGGHSCYHGYATTDYYKVDPRFGTNDEYRAFIDEAHQKGLKVVMDMIFNHCGSSHPWMEDAPSKDWFNNPNYGLQTSYKLTTVVDPYASQVDLAETVDGWFVESMPDLNQRNEHLMTYLIQNSEWWIETVGIDGIRMDTYPYADATGMARWMKVLNTEYPNFNVVGESWVTEPAFTAALQKGSKITPEAMFGGSGETDTYLNTVMDFTFFDRINQAKTEETDAWWNGLNRIYNGLVYDYLYADPSSVLAFLDNHDTDRFLGEGCDTLALKQALSILLTMKRIPQLYYGTEILMGGTKAITDGYVRCDFPGGFAGDSRNAFTAEGRTKAQDAMFQWLSKLLHWRKGNDVIIKGKQIQFIPVDGVYVMHHEYNGKHVLVVLNGTNDSATFKHARYKECIPEGTTARDVTSNRKYSLSRDITLRPRQSLVLEY